MTADNHRDDEKNHACCPVADYQQERRQKRQTSVAVCLLNLPNDVMACIINYACTDFDSIYNLVEAVGDGDKDRMRRIVYEQRWKCHSCTAELFAANGAPSQRTAAGAEGPAAPFVCAACRRKFCGGCDSDDEISVMAVLGGVPAVDPDEARSDDCRPITFLTKAECRKCTEAYFQRRDDDAVLVRRVLNPVVLDLFRGVNPTVEASIQSMYVNIKRAVVLGRYRGRTPPNTM